MWKICSYYNAIQIAQERYTAQDQYGGTTTAIDEPFSVAVVKDAGISQLASLRDKKACFTGLWDAHGFMLPLDSIKKNVLGDQSDCRHLQTAQVGQNWELLGWIIDIFSY